MAPTDSPEQALAQLERSRVGSGQWGSGMRLRGALVNVMEGVQNIGPEHRYPYYNEVAARQAPMEGEEMPGRTIIGCCPGVEGAGTSQGLAECMENRAPGKTVNVFELPGGSGTVSSKAFNPCPRGCSS